MNYTYEEIRLRIRLECHRRHFILRLRKKFKQVAHQVLKTSASNESFNIWLLESLAMSALNQNSTNPTSAEEASSSSITTSTSYPASKNYDYLIPIRFPKGSDRISRSLLNSFPCAHRHPSNSKDERRFAEEYLEACQSVLSEDKGSELRKLVGDIRALPAETTRYYFETREAATPFLLDVLTTHVAEICAAMLTEATAVSNEFVAIRNAASAVVSSPPAADSRKNGSGNDNTCNNNNNNKDNSKDKDKDSGNSASQNDVPPSSSSLLTSSSSPSSTSSSVPTPTPTPTPSIREVKVKGPFIDVQAVFEKDGDEFVRLSLRREDVLDPSDPSQHLLEYKIRREHYEKLKSRARLNAPADRPFVSLDSFLVGSSSFLSLPPSSSLSSSLPSPLYSGALNQIKKNSPSEAGRKRRAESALAPGPDSEETGVGAVDAAGSDSSSSPSSSSSSPSASHHPSASQPSSYTLLAEAEAMAIDALIWCVLHRYNSLAGPEGNGGGWQMAAPPEVYEYLQNRFQIMVECFASPLNCTLRKFCSAFYDTDAPFGSQGNFFRDTFRFEDYVGSFDMEVDRRAIAESGRADSGVEPSSDTGTETGTGGAVLRDHSVMQGFSSFQLNPPYDEEILDEMAQKVLAAAAAVGESRPLQFIFVLPYWPECRGIRRLRDSHLKSEELVLVKDEHRYVNGFQHFARSKHRMVLFECETLMLFLQNDAARRVPGWEVSQGTLDELKHKWRGDKGRVK